MTPLQSLPLLFAFALLPRAAAADSPVVSWSITGPAACASDVQRIHDEMAIACAAVGGCRLGAPGETTDRRAIVTCGADAWNVTARSDDGELWDMRIDAHADDRARQTAMWIARSERDPAPSPPAPAVERATAAAHVLSRAHAVAEGDVIPEPPRRRALALSLELQGLGEQGQIRRGSLVGLNGVWTLPLGRGFSFGPALGAFSGTFEDNEPTPKAHHVMVVRPAARLAWGAPSEDHNVGLSLDLGTWVTFQDGYGRPPVAIVPYAQPSIYLQWPLGKQRPFVALNGMAGLADPHRLVRRAGETFGPLGMGIALGISWSGP